jgi:hypothetical protein
MLTNKQAADFRSYLEEYYKTREYSGRGMFGKKCIAFNTLNINEAIWEIASNIPDSLKELDIKYPKTDNMGLEYIVYWPSIPYVEEDSEDKEE